MSLLQIFNIYIYINFQYVYVCRTSCRKSLPSCILRVIASCVNSTRTHYVPLRNCNVDLEPEIVYLNKGIARGGGSCACSTASGIAREWELSGWPALGNTQLTAHVHVARLATCVTSDAQIWRQQRTRRPV